MYTEIHVKHCQEKEACISVLSTYTLVYRAPYLYHYVYLGSSEEKNLVHSKAIVVPWILPPSPETHLFAVCLYEGHPIPDVHSIRYYTHSSHNIKYVLYTKETWRNQKDASCSCTGYIKQRKGHKQAKSYM